MWPHIRDVELVSNCSEAELFIKSARRSAGIAPEKPGAVFARKLNACHHERAPKSSAAHLRRGGHAAQLKRWNAALFRHFHGVKRGDAEQPAFAKGAEVPRAR